MPANSESSPEDATFRGFAPGMRVFNRFRLEAIIGRGGMGIVWKAVDEKLAEPVALKFLPEALTWDAVARKQLVDETQLSRRLTHPNIVRIHDLFEDPLGLAIGMEWVDGKDMNHLRLQRPQGVFEPGEIAGWLEQLLAALDYAHGEGRTVHRDLKPSNLLLTHDGRVKVSDFGVACGVAETLLRVSTYSAAGTLAYMSPQHYDGDPPTPADDWYALGATLYDLITGKPPFFRGAVAEQIRSRRPERLAVRRAQLGVTGADIPECWERLIAALLAKEPEERPANGAAVRRLLGEETGAAATGVPNTAGAEPVAAPGGANRWERITVGVLAIGMAAWAVGWGLGRSPGNGPAPTAETVSAGNARGNASAEGGRASDPDVAETLLHFPLFHDGQDAGPQRLATVDRLVTYQVDHDGRIGAEFTGDSWIRTKENAAMALGSEDHFRVAFELWPRRDESRTPQSLVMLQRSQVGEFSIRMSRNRNDLHVLVGPTHEEHRSQVLGRDVLVPERWQRVEVRYSPKRLQVWVDELLVGEARVDDAEIARGTLGTFEFGGNPRQRNGFTGFMRELRFDRLVPEVDPVGRADSFALAQHMVLADPAAQPAGDPFALTTTTALATEDLTALAQTQFGPQTRLAEWERFRTWLEGESDPAAAVARIGLEFGHNAFVTRGGERFYGETRQYFLTRFNGVVPDYYLAHDTAAEKLVCLGSWHGVTLAVLAEAPVGRLLIPPEETIDGNLDTLPRAWRWLGDGAGRVRSENSAILIETGPGRTELRRNLARVYNADSMVLSTRILLAPAPWGARVMLYFFYTDGRIRRLSSELAEHTGGLQVFSMEDGDGRVIRRGQTPEAGVQELILMVNPTQIRAVIRRAADGLEFFSETMDTTLGGGGLAQCGVELVKPSGPPVRLDWIKLRAEAAAPE